MAGEEGKFTIVDKDGNKIECDVLFTFESDKTHKNYIVYTDNTKDELGNTKVYASVYDPKNPGASLAPIETEEEWKAIEKILEEIQKEVREDTEIENKVDFRTEDGIEIEMTEEDDDFGEIQDWINALPSIETSQPMDDASFESYVHETKKAIKEKKKDSMALKEVIDDVSLKMLGESELSRTDTLFDLLDGIDEISSSEYSNMAMAAYEKHNYAVSEKGFRKAIEKCGDDELLVGYKNNLAYLIRRGEIRAPESRSAKEVVVLLRDGTEKKDTFSIINMALLWALDFGKESDWDMADNLVSLIDRNNVINALIWWQDVAKTGEAEGFLVHLLMIRHGKIGSSPLGSMTELFAKVKKDYPGIPEKMKEIITPFDGGKTDELPILPPWIGDDTKW